MTTPDETTVTFFRHYADALLARDVEKIAAMYAVPALILFPGQAIPVSATEQTEQFFAASWSQYEGVDTADHRITIMGQGPGTIWADVTWSYGNQTRERFCYQLVMGDQGAQIAVLTPLDLPDPGRSA